MRPGRVRRAVAAWGTQSARIVPPAITRDAAPDDDLASMLPLIPMPSEDSFPVRACTSVTTRPPPARCGRPGRGCGVPALTTHSTDAAFTLPVVHLQLDRILSGRPGTPGMRSFEAHFTIPRSIPERSERADRDRQACPLPWQRRGSPPCNGRGHALASMPTPGLRWSRDVPGGCSPARLSSLPRVLPRRHRGRREPPDRVVRGSSPARSRSSRTRSPGSCSPAGRGSPGTGRLRATLRVRLAGRPGGAALHHFFSSPDPPRRWKNDIRPRRKSFETKQW